MRGGLHFNSHSHLEYIRDQRFGQHVDRLARRGDPPPPQDDELVAEHRGKIDIMQGNDRRDRQAAEKSKQLELMPDVVSGYLSGSIKPLAQDFGQSRAYRMRDFNQTALEKALAFFGSGLTHERIEAAKRSTECACSQ